MAKKKELVESVNRPVKIVGVRLPGAMYTAIEDIYFNRAVYMRSRSLVMRMLFEKALANLDDETVTSLVAQQKAIAKVNDSSAHDCTIELPLDLFHQIEEFRWSRRIFKRSVAMRILLMHALRINPVSS